MMVAFLRGTGIGKGEPRLTARLTRIVEIIRFGVCTQGRRTRSALCVYCITQKAAQQFVQVGVSGQAVEAKLFYVRNICNL